MSDEELFLTAILDCKRVDLYTQRPKLTADQQRLLESMLNRRAAGEPVQYITGFTEFLGRRIQCGPGVLIPRPETEVLADSVIQELKTDDRHEHFILDIGTGSACLTIALIKELPNCRAVAIDVSDKALTFARKNAELNGVADRVSFIKRDVFWFLGETADRFDAVIANPPYVPTFMLEKLPADVKKEPAVALDGGPDGLHFYRYIIPTSLNVLKTDGLLAMEFGDGQRTELQKLFAVREHWDKIRFINDLAGKPRVALARKR